MISPRSVLIHGALLAGAAVVLTAQVSSDRYGPLIRAPALTDAQMSQLPQVPTAPVRAAPTGGGVEASTRVGSFTYGSRPVGFPQAVDLIPGTVLDSAQQAKLAEIAKVLQRYDTAASAIVLGLMDAEEWPAGWPCVKPYSRADNYSKEFDLTAERVRRFEKLQQDVRQRAVDHLWETGNRTSKARSASRPLC
jgi:hypothetical protein